MTTMPTPDPDWPSWATEPVELVAPDPTWSARGRIAKHDFVAGVLSGRHAGGGK